MLSANFKPKTTAAALRGSLATARLSCSFKNQRKIYVFIIISFVEFRQSAQEQTSYLAGPRFHTFHGPLAPSLSPLPSPLPSPPLPSLLFLFSSPRFRSTPFPFLPLEVGSLKYS